MHCCSNNLNNVQQSSISVIFPEKPRSFLNNDYLQHIKVIAFFAIAFFIDKMSKSDILPASPYGGYERRVGMTEEHKHQHQDTKKILDRMSRAIGHMESIKRMVEGGRDCSEILIQLSAVRSAINNVGKIVLQDHINNCVVDAVATGDKKVLEDLNSAVDKFL